MTGRGFRAMGAEWWIAADREDLLPTAEVLVQALDVRLTRFSATSALARLNRERRSDDRILRELLAESLRLRDATGGAFDPTLGRDLADLGYDRPFAEIAAAGAGLGAGAGAALGAGAGATLGSTGAAPDADAAPRGPAPAAPPRARPTPLADRRIHLTPTGVALEGAFDVDLGGIGKGWAVDHVHDWLRGAGATRVLVDGGGDLRGSGGEWPIGVEDGGAVRLGDGAIATSSTRVRRWTAADGEARHHVLDPRTGAPAASEVEVATVRAATATLADVLATALIVDPTGVLPRLAALGAEAMVGDATGQWWVTPGWRAAA